MKYNQTEWWMKLYTKEELNVQMLNAQIHKESMWAPCIGSALSRFRPPWTCSTSCSFILEAPAASGHPLASSWSGEGTAALHSSCQTLTGASWRLTTLLGLSFGQDRRGGSEGGKGGILGGMEEGEREGGKEEVGRAISNRSCLSAWYRVEEWRCFCFVS